MAGDKDDKYGKFCMHRKNGGSSERIGMFYLWNSGLFSLSYITTLTLFSPKMVRKITTLMKVLRQLPCRPCLRACGVASGRRRVVLPPSQVKSLVEMHRTLHNGPFLQLLCAFLCPSNGLNEWAVHNASHMTACDRSYEQLLGQRWRHYDGYLIQPDPS